jgi:hypothetical protein
MKARSAAFILLLVLPVLQSCAVWPPGKDPAGLRLIEKANTVLRAAQVFQAAEGRSPNTLDELVPKYIESLPREPSVWLVRATDALSFHYSPTLGWGQCACSATLSDSTFSCGICYV